MSKKDAIVCDLDGTLCDLRHRLHYMQVRPKMREEFHGAADKDEVYQDVRLTLIAHTLFGDKILIVTCRPESYRDSTVQWLRSHDVPFDDLIMRADGDCRPDAEIKEGIYRWHIAPHYDVKMVLEDRTSVVQMWRALGLNCWQVREFNG